jgi:DsbC/DsbD-like thiol-disulfide interchange protein
VVATIDSIFARRGRPRGLKRLEATLDQSLDEAAANLVDKAREAGPGEGTAMSPAALEARAQELEVVNEALRQRLATERLRFGERAALLEKAANTSVESAIKAVHGQDVIVRRRLEETEREMRRLQEETALQQAELREIHASWTMRAAAPARAWFGRLRGSSS